MVLKPTAAPDFRCGNHRSLIRSLSMNSVRVTRNLGMLLLGIWLILSGLTQLLSLSFAGLGTLLALIAVAAGALILVGR
jgi:hypothetical protein